MTDPASPEQVVWDVDVLEAALRSDHPDHEGARARLEWVALGFEQPAVLAGSLVTTVERLGRRGIEESWARERAVDLGVVCRVLDLLPDDVTSGITLAQRRPRAGLRVCVIAEILRRHGIETIVSADERFELVGLRREPIAAPEGG